MSTYRHWSRSDMAIFTTSVVNSATPEKKNCCIGLLNTPCSTKSFALFKKKIEIEKREDSIFKRCCRDIHFNKSTFPMTIFVRNDQECHTRKCHICIYCIYIHGEQVITCLRCIRTGIFWFKLPVYFKGLIFFVLFFISILDVKIKLQLK